MRDINTAYRESVLKANADHVRALSEAGKKLASAYADATREYMRAVAAATQAHVALVSASEIAWETSAERKIAQFQGDEGIAALPKPSVNPEDLEKLEDRFHETTLQTHD